MSNPGEPDGYSNTQRRTRDALLTAARELVAKGHSPTVDETAVAAAVSRTTAYRYFPNKTALLLAAHPEVGASSLLPPDPPQDAVARLDAVVDRFVDLVLESEASQRAMLRISLENDQAVRAALPLRQGRAIGWITEALQPLEDQLTQAGVHQLAVAIRSAIGIEALVWLTDVAGLSRTDAGRLMRWSAMSLLAAAMASGPPPLEGNT